MVMKYNCPPPDSAFAEKLFSTVKHVLGQTLLTMKPANMERNLFLKCGLRAMNYGGYGRLSNVSEDFIVPNAAFMPKPTTETVPEDDTLDNIEIDISSNVSDNEG